MEASSPSARRSALRQPLGNFPMSGSPSTAPLASFIKEMPPPKTSAPRSTPQDHVKFTDQEALELAADVGVSEQTDLARAVLAQSQALTALVGQIANNSSDPLLDLASTSTGVSSRGAAGRARLQQELAAQKGTFHAAGMQPSQPADISLEMMRDKGITATRYLERFGGYGKVKEYGHLAWQVALTMDHFQSGNYKAAMDSTALMMTCLEQVAMDSGKMELGLLLSLAEEPPQSMFSNRSLAQSSRPLAFAPLADQKWVTTAMQYVKELDAIQNRRSETNPNPTPKPQNQTPTPNPKKKQKGGGKGKTKEKAEEEAE